MAEKIYYCGTGRRKNAIARVRLTEGSGKITINGKDIEEFFGMETLKVIAKQPLTVTNTLTKYDVIAKVTGGGFTGRDPRMKERKKYGLKKARKAPQFSKR